MQALFDQELSRQIARSTRLGIAEMVQQQLQRALSGDGENQSLIPSVDRLLQSSPAIGTPPVHRLRPFEPIIEKAARTHNLNANLIRSVILAESSGNPRAVSPKGAKGLMQLMDATARELGVRNPFDPEENILAGSAYLARMLARFGGDLTLALAAYNAGPTAVEKYDGIPPFTETRLYIRKVLSFLRHLDGR
ncbi:MAG: transglycosylase SLT domain-containing protein [Calditrichaeota bacterium]|nr:transglycosylase SLT domain-containing protein [Calditrichota bacterium]